MDEITVVEAILDEIRALPPAQQRTTIAMQALLLAETLQCAPPHAVAALSKELRTVCEVLFGSTKLTREVAPVAGKKGATAPVPGGDELDQLRQQKRKAGS